MLGTFVPEAKLQAWLRRTRPLLLKAVGASCGWHGSSYDAAGNSRVISQGGHTMVGEEVLPVCIVHLEAQQHGDVPFLVERRHQRFAHVRRIHGHHDVKVGPHAVEADGPFPLKAPAVGVVVPPPGGRVDGPAATEQPVWSVTGERCTKGCLACTWCINMESPCRCRAAPCAAKQMLRQQPCNLRGQHAGAPDGQQDTQQEQANPG